MKERLSPEVRHAKVILSLLGKLDIRDQARVLDRLLVLEMAMTTRAYMHHSGLSRSGAKRVIYAMMACGAITREGEGRNTRYIFRLDKDSVSRAMGLASPWNLGGQQ